MAHAATLNALAGSLVASITGRNQNPNDAKFARIKDRTLRGLRDQSHASTNQFAVKARYNGLTEKFAVLDRQDLADGLQNRLDELPPSSPWLPEILSLLLELSDRPVANTSLQALDKFAEPVDANIGPTWEEIVADDPLDETGIWDDVDRGHHSSEDDFEAELDSEPTLSTNATSLDEDDPSAVAKLHVEQIHLNALTQVQATRDIWKPDTDRQERQTISELALVREVLFMTHGLPTDLFDVDEAGHVMVQRSIRLSDTSTKILLDVLRQACHVGTALNFLRQWNPNHSDLAYMQTLHGAIERSLSKFGLQLSAIEQSFANPSSDAIVSVAKVQAMIDEAARPLVKLSSMARSSLQATGSGAHFALLDSLYMQTCITQLSGDQDTFKVLGSIFLAGLKTYLRAVAIWIKSGTVDSQSSGSFFISDARQSCQPEDLWHGRYELRWRDKDKTYAPECVQGFTNEIFALGKSRTFLHQLEQRDDELQPMATITSLLPDFAPLLEQCHADSLALFPQVLHDGLRSWIAEMTTNCTPLLRTRLLQEYGLLRSLRSLPLVYFSADSALFQDFAQALFHRVKHNQRSWADAFLLTESAHDTIGSHPALAAEHIHIVIADDHLKAQSAGSRNLQMLSSVGMACTWSWPIQNITRFPTSAIHSKVFTLLLHICYASSILQSAVFDLRSNESGSASTMALRQRLLCFNNTLYDHITRTAASIHSDMVQRMQEALDIDSMVALWAEYEKILQTGLLLYSNMAPMREVILDILAMSEVLSTRRSADLQSQFAKSLPFLIAGIRAVSRAGGEPTLEVLAERLDWIIPP